MTLEGIEQYMSVELGDRMRTISASELMRTFSQSFDTVQAAMKKFVTSSNCLDNVFVAVSESGENDTRLRVIRLNEVSELASTATWWYYMIKPGNESATSAWQREVDFMKKSVSDSSPDLWPGACVYANIVSDESVRERQVQIRVEQQPTAKTVGQSSTQVVTTSSQSLANRNKLGFSKMSGPVVSKVEQPVAKPYNSPKKAPQTATKYQVPLDSLEGQAPGTPEPAGEVTPEMEIDTEPARDSPETKRQKVEEIVQDESESPEVPFSPKFREVVIKKKVVVSEYEMNEHGEMTVRDVEKMVEEVVREQIKVPDRRPKPMGLSGGAKKKSTSSAPAGQGTLTGFFKKT